MTTTTELQQLNDLLSFKWATTHDMGRTLSLQQAQGRRSLGRPPSKHGSWQEACWDSFALHLANHSLHMHHPLFAFCLYPRACGIWAPKAADRHLQAPLYLSRSAQEASCHSAVTSVLNRVPLCQHVGPFVFLEKNAVLQLTVSHNTSSGRNCWHR